MTDLAAVDRAVAGQVARPTAGVGDIATYCAAQNNDLSHRAVLGPLLPGAGASGLVLQAGETLATWGDPTRPEMAFSVTKSFLSLVAGLAVDDGTITLDVPVQATVALPELADGPPITWRHLLTQTSGWRGVLWGKPTTVDAQSHDVPGAAQCPGQAWAYNDVRVNLLALALTVALARPLPEVFDARIAQPLGLTRTWSWHGYRHATVVTGGREVAVVSGGAHWGGGLWMSAADLAAIGQLYLRRGAGRVDPNWIDQSWTPTPVRPDYGLCWWLNDNLTVFPRAPRTGRCARGNLGRHLLWVDPARELVIASHWGEHVEELLVEVSAALDSHPA